MNRNAIQMLAALLAAATLFASSPAAQQQAAKKAGGTPAPAEPPAISATSDPGYLIGEDDILFVNVWKEPEISRSVPVRPDGKISLPLINDVQAAGMTPTQLSALITERLKKSILDPQVTVIVTTINSRRIYIVGEVTRAGAFPLIPNMTVLQALSSAGGFTQFANLKGIYVLRLENGKQTKFPFNYKDVIKGVRIEQNIVLKPGDTIVVP